MGSQCISPFSCITADPENSGGAPSLAWAPSRYSGPGEMPSSSWAVVIRGTSCSQHQAGKYSRKEKGRQKAEKEAVWGGTHRAGKAGPNLAVSYFRTVPWGPQTRDPGGGESGVQTLLFHVSWSGRPLLTDKGEEGEKAGLPALVLGGDGSWLAEPERVCRRRSVQWHVHDVLGGACWIASTPCPWYLVVLSIESSVGYR